MFTCAQCAIEACRSGKLDQMPKNCPMHDPAFFEQVLEEYFKPENHDFFVASAAVEAIGYPQSAVAMKPLLNGGERKP